MKLQQEKKEGSAKDPQKQTSTVSYGDTIMMELFSAPGTLNPAYARGSKNKRVLHQIYSSLFKYDDNLEHVGDLAETWKISADYKSIHIKLREGVKWHDGVDFTAKDVVFTCDFYLNPDFKARPNGMIDYLATVEIIDEYSVRFNYDRPHPEVFTSLNGGMILPEHQFRSLDAEELHENFVPIGTGPFKFVNHNPRENIILEANDDYFNGRPFVNKWIHWIIPDVSESFLSLKRGELDICELDRDQYTKQVQNEEFKKQYRFVVYPDINFYKFIGYNFLHPELKKKKIRKALTMAINRNYIVEDMRYGFGSVISGPFTPQLPAYNKEIQPLEYSEEKARALLAEMGWSDTDGDGFVDKNGKNLTITIRSSKSTTNNMILEFVDKCWKKAGIDSSIELSSWNDLLDDGYSKNFDAYLFGWRFDYDPVPTGLFHSSKIPSSREGAEGNNIVSYKNDAVDKILEQADEEINKDKKHKLMRQLHAMIHEDQPYTFLYSTDIIFAVHKRIHGVKVVPQGMFHDVERWFVPKDLQKY